MLMSRCILAIAMVGLLSTVAEAKIKTPTLRDQEQAACYNDATTLCKDEVPDEKKIETCMRAKINQVSAGCRKFFH